MERNNFEQAGDIHYGHPERQSIPFFNFLLFLVCLLALVLFVIGLVHNWSLLMNAATGVAEAVLVLAAFTLPLLILGGLCYVGFTIWMWATDKMDTRLERKEALRRDNERHATEMELARRHIPVDVRGNAVLHRPNGEIIQITGNYSPYANVTHLSITNHGSARADGDIPALPGGNKPTQVYIGEGVTQPSQRFLISQLEQDMLQVSPGVYGADGRPLILNIPDAVHFKLIGSSGFGKSCLAGAMLEQALTTNSPDVLQVALLDLEHKTSRLFENSPNVAMLDIGRRRVQMVATNADEVAEHLGYLKKELDRRAVLSEYDLQMEALMLIYVEEMLSLQYEVDERLIEQMLKDLSILALRGRKYNMFLLACAQTDYSTPELKNAQKQFSTRIAFAVPQTAARAAGFQSAELIKYNFTHAQKGDGQFVLETPGVASLMLAPVFDVKAKVLASDKRVSPRVEPVYLVRNGTVESDNTPSTQALHTPNTGLNTDATHPLQAKLEQVAHYRSMNWGKIKIIEKIWDCKHGTNKKYKDAEAEYNLILAELESEAVNE